MESKDREAMLAGATFDPLQWCILGYVSSIKDLQKDESTVKIAKIIPVTVCDESSSNWNLSVTSVIGNNLSYYFPKTGKVFYYGIDRKIPDIKEGELLEFYVRKDNKEQECLFIVDYNKPVEPVSLPLVITVNNSEVYTHLSHDSFYDIEEQILPDSVIEENRKIYVSVIKGDNVICLGDFRSKMKSGKMCLIPGYGKDVSAFRLKKSQFEEYTLSIGANTYLLNERMFAQFGYGIIDCMTDKQLAEWAKDVVRQHKDFDVTKHEMLLGLLNPEVFNDSLSKIRASRIREKLDFGYVVEILGGFDAAISRYAEKNSHLKEAVYKRFQAEVEEEDSKLGMLRKELESVTSAIRTKQSELISIDSIYSKKRTELESSLQDSRQELSDIRNDIEMYTRIRKTAESINKSDVYVDYYVVDDNDRFVFSTSNNQSDYELTVGRKLKENTKGHGFPYDFTASLGDDYAFLNTDAMFIPDCSWAYAYANVLGKCKVACISVEYDWLHYKDYVNAGLEQVWLDATLDQDFSYILILDSLNIVSPQAGLRPLLDVLSGKRPALGNTGMSKPDNLKIMATLLPSRKDDDSSALGLSLDLGQFSLWGAVASPEKGSVKIEKTDMPVLFSPADIKHSLSAGDPEIWKKSLEAYLAF